MGSRRVKWDHLRRRRREGTQEKVTVGLGCCGGRKGRWEGEFNQGEGRITQKEERGGEITVRML